MTEIRAAGGLCAPVNTAYDIKPLDGIWPNRIQLKRGWRRFFSWDKNWGLRLRGGPVPKLRELLPVFRAERGGITYSR